MAWKVSGQSVELCSCKMLCPCWLGPEGEPDQGWCGGAFAFDIREGNSDGVDLAGSKVVWVAEWPANFFSGNGTARLYTDESARQDQRRELEAIFSGNKGGHLEGLFGAVITRWLPPQSTKIDIQWGENPSITVGSVGQAKLQPIKDAAGRPTKVQGAAAQAGFQIESMDLASSKGSRFADPDLHAWEGDSGTLHRFNWSA
ncbi:MAG TPA: DUF1326 domain-containing protein [Dehalococcoidia bacterium]|nr:DUF1326 domain-containing protein [Dehalococcoidia bacterium]